MRTLSPSQPRARAVRRLLIDGIDSLLIEPRATTGQPDGWGWDWERWRR